MIKGFLVTLFLLPLAASLTDILQGAGVILVGAFSLAGVIYTQRTTSRVAAAQREADRSVNQESVRQHAETEAYDRARTSYEASIARYEADLARVSAHADAANDRADRANARADRAMERVDVLEGILRANGMGMAIPPRAEED